MARRLCLSVFLPPLFLQKDLPYQASQGSVPVVSWPFSELGYLEGSFRDEASFTRSLPFVDFSTSGQDTQGQLKVFYAQFCWHFGFALLRALSYKKDPGRLCFSCSLLSFGNYTFFQRQGRLPPAATKPVRSSSSFTVESLLRSAAVKLPAPGNKPGTGEDGRHFEACNSSASSQCCPRCAPQGLLLLWGALEGLGQLSSLAGEAFPQAAGPDLSSGQGADWDTVIRCLRW